MVYKAFQNPAYRYINPNKSSPGSDGNFVELKKHAKEFKDVSLAFTPHPITEDLTIIRNERAINNAIKNLVMYHFGDVPFQNDVGSDVRNYMFETMDAPTASFIEDEVKRVIVEYEPRAIIEGEANPHPYDLGQVTSSRSYTNEPMNARNEGYNSINQYVKEKGQRLGVWAEVNDAANAIEVTIIYRIVGYDQVFKIEHILYPTRV